MKRKLQRAIRISKRSDGVWVCHLPGTKGTVLYRGTRTNCRIHKRNTIATLVWILSDARSESE